MVRTLEKKHIGFRVFNAEDANKVVETILNGQDVHDDSVISEIYEIVKCTMVDGKVGNELLQIYGNKDNYLFAVEESALHSEVIAELQEELKNIHFAFRDVSEDNNGMEGLVKRLEENIKKMFQTASARLILLKVAEDYLEKGKNEQVLDNIYGTGVTETIG